MIKGTQVYVREGGIESFRGKELTAGIYPNPFCDLAIPANNKQHLTALWPTNSRNIYSQQCDLREKVVVYFPLKAPSAFPCYSCPILQREDGRAT